MDTEQTGLIERIRHAFAGVELGSGISLNMTEYHDSYGCETDFLTLAKHDERHNWQAIPDQTLEQFTVTFCFTDIEGFRFYLPAYMVWTIKNHKVSDSIIADHTIYSIDTNLYQFQDHALTSAFTDQQLSCIVEFLSFCVRNNDTVDGDVAELNLQKLQTELENRNCSPPA